MRQLLIALLILSATQLAHSANDSAHGKHAHEHSEVHEHRELSLNHGEKWKMDAHTRAMFISMSERLHAGGDLKEMGKKLNEDIHKLIEGCTMTGSAHDQLHLFLSPYIPAVHELSHEGTEKALEKVKHKLHGYQSYFE